MRLCLSPVLSPKNNLKLPSRACATLCFMHVLPRAHARPLRPAVFAPVCDTVLYCALTYPCARSRATCVSLLKWGATRASARDWCHFLSAHHQPASSEQFSKS